MSWKENSFERNSSTVPFREKSEQEEKPEVLFRAFSVSAEDLSLELLKNTLVPGSVRKDDSTKIGDGNELGVYMSTNESVADIYAHTRVSGAYVRVPQCKLNGSVTNILNLPVCGVLVEIRTKNLSIRRPKISPTLHGHYNNGFQGEELIADAVPKENFRIKKLFLSKGFRDSEVFDVLEMSDDEIREIIDSIKKKFDQEKTRANLFKSFIESLPEKDRYHPFLLKNFEKYKAEHENPHS